MVQTPREKRQRLDEVDCSSPFGNRSRAFCRRVQHADPCPMLIFTHIFRWTQGQSELAARVFST
jgi:hypothetical protein